MTPLIHGWQPQPLSNPSPKSLVSSAQALARWLVVVWERPGGEGNDLLRTALPGCPNLGVQGNWPQSADIDDVLRALVKAGWLEQHFYCPDLTMVRYVFPGAPVEKAKDVDGIGFYAAGYSYRPNFGNKDYAKFVEQWRPLLATLPRAGKLGPGDRVRMTTQFLASTGQIQSSEAKKIWKVKPCACDMCDRGRHVAVDERRDTPQDLKYYEADPEYCEYLRHYPWRHVAVANLRRV
jgi:hypothetical protein